MIAVVTVVFVVESHSNDHQNFMDDYNLVTEFTELRRTLCLLFRKRLFFEVDGSVSAVIVVDVECDIEDVFDAVEILLMTIGWHISVVIGLIVELGLGLFAELNDGHLPRSKLKSFRCPAPAIAAAANGNGTNR